MPLCMRRPRPLAGRLGGFYRVDRNGEHRKGFEDGGEHAGPDDPRRPAPAL